ncbi:MAG: LrgB family protein, partial [Acinetobacter sp.]
AAHAIGTAQAWQRGSIAGRYAAFGMAVNAVFTAIWLPTFILYLQKM